MILNGNPQPFLIWNDWSVHGFRIPDGHLLHRVHHRTPSKLPRMLCPQVTSVGETNPHEHHKYIPQIKPRFHLKLLSINLAIVKGGPTCQMGELISARFRVSSGTIWCSTSGFGPGWSHLSGSRECLLCARRRGRAVLGSLPRKWCFAMSGKKVCLRIQCPKDPIMIR